MKDDENEPNNFCIKYNEAIERLYELYKNDINKNESSRLIKTLIGLQCLTIFEAFNLIYREVQIIKTFKSEKNNEENMILFKNENKDEYEPIEFNKVIEKYKIKSDDKDLEESWKPINKYEERRIIKINKNNNIFNYLPIKNEYINLDNKNKEELYSKNDNEYLYHPLFYKTIMCHYCKIEKNNNKILCPFSHDIQTDFRIIYDYKNEEIQKFLNYLYNNELFTFINYINYIPINQSKFDLNNFKLFKCPFENKCKEDKHLCPFYHSPGEKRRPLLLFRYSIDDKCFDKKNKKYKVEDCPFGIFCNGIHSQYEYNYHPKIFRKEVKCIREKKNGHCIFIKTCYGIHPEEEYKIYEEELKNKIEKIKNEDKEIKELNDKKTSIINVSEYFKCRNCNNLPKKGKIKLLNECKHFLCKNCYEEIYEEGDKICPFCESNISKKNIINLYFAKK